MKKIGVFSPINPFSYDSGARIRIYQITKYIVEHFTKNGFSVDFIFLDDLKNEDPIRMPFYENCNLISFSARRTRLAAVFDMLLHQKSYRSAKFFSNNLKAFIERNINQYALVYVNFFDLLQHFKSINAESNLKIFVDTHNDDFHWYESFEKKSFFHSIFGKLNKKFFLKENKDVSKFVEATVNVSIDDAKTLDERLGIEKNIVIPNGVVIADEHPPKEINQKFSILFCASLSVTMNVDAIQWFIKKVFPIINTNNEVVIQIVGRNPNRNVLKLFDQDRIEIYANVDSLKEFYERANLVVLPFKMGGGSKLKLLESLSYGVPIVASDIGLVGCEDLKKYVYLSEMTPHDFAGKIIELINNYSEALRKSSSGKKYVNENYSWVKVSSQLIHTLEKHIN